ncbi:MAG: glycosyl hydrolase family 57 [Gammaproteobacteria bacterium]|nr:glycosyl hydrolase family 57 [Gammaproteobacteria bacterium]
MNTFSNILDIDCPDTLECSQNGMNPSFDITFRTDGKVPFPQIIVHGQGTQKLFNQQDISQLAQTQTEHAYKTTIPEGLLSNGNICIQVEGCRRENLDDAGSEDWIKAFHELRLIAKTAPVPKIEVSGSVKVYYGIHKHMHQPYYQADDPAYWDGEKDQIFGSRSGNYTSFIPNAVNQYSGADLPHAGLSTSWSGTLIEQLNRCSDQGLCGGAFNNWNQQLTDLADSKTALGHPRVAFTAFGFYHPLMALIPERDIVRQIEWHRDIIRSTFGVDASRILFPPETAFHVRMIPALNQAGIKAVIYDSIHRFRACQDYPYAGPGEGLLPPNQAEQCNPAVEDWLQLDNIWAGSKISPTLLKPEYVGYCDADGKQHKIIAVPAERYIGNEDARGGFGALQYPSVLGQVYNRIAETGSFDEKHPPFFVLHSDGDNHGGGADSYYGHNTGEMVRWLQNDPRFELTGIEDYLQRFPPNPEHTIHIEPGSWSGADNGDPQFMKWFSRYDQSYSPDLNSWAVLTAFQNLVYTLEDCQPQHPALHDAIRLLLTAETSCYWYWTGQTNWDSQVTFAVNHGYRKIQPIVADLLKQHNDQTAPTIFSPWVTPENPGGKRWGQGCLNDADREATVHSFVHDVSGLKHVVLVLKTANGEHRIDMRDLGPYPSQTGASLSANYYTAQLPVGTGDVRYYIEAVDQLNNTARSSLERIYLA